MPQKTCRQGFQGCQGCQGPSWAARLDTCSARSRRTVGVAAVCRAQPDVTMSAAAARPAVRRVRAAGDSVRGRRIAVRGCELAHPRLAAGCYRRSCGRLPTYLHVGARRCGARRQVTLSLCLNGHHTPQTMSKGTQACAMWVCPRTGPKGPNGCVNELFLVWRRCEHMCWIRM